MNPKSEIRNPKSAPLVLAITGASGAIYAVRLLDVLLSAGREVHLTISPAGAKVIEHELRRRVNLTDFDLDSLLPGREEVGQLLHYHRHDDFMAPIASGSFLTDAMVVCPCSGGTLSGVVHGTSGNLIHRAADVHLKERRKLILVPRETPLSAIAIENMHRAALAGAVMLPATPGFYHDARTIDDLVDFIVARICDQLGVEHNLTQRWGKSKAEVNVERRTWTSRLNVNWLIDL